MCGWLAAIAATPPACLTWATSRRRGSRWGPTAGCRTWSGPAAPAARCRPLGLMSMPSSPGSTSVHRAPVPGGGEMARVVQRWPEGRTYWRSSVQIGQASGGVFGVGILDRAGGADPQGHLLTILPRRMTRRGWLSTARSRRGSASKTTRSAGTPSASVSGWPSQARARQEPAPSAYSGELKAAERGHLLADQPVRQEAARVGAGIDRDPGLPGLGEPLEPARRTGTGCAARTRGTWPRRRVA